MYRTTQSSLKLLTNSVLMQNYNFTEMTRKRKFDVCTALGPSFRPYAFAEDTGDYLFGAETLKAMKSELKKVNVKVKKDQYSKNLPASGKAPRSHQSGGSGNYNRNNNGNRNSNHNQNRYHQNNQNNNNNNNNSNHQRNQQTRNRGRARRF